VKSAGLATIRDSNHYSVHDFFRNDVQQDLMGLVLYDPDDWMVCAYSKQLKDYGYQIKTFNSACFCSSTGYNPFIYAQNDSSLAKLASAFISGTKGYNVSSDDKFTSAETALLTAVFACFANCVPNNEKNFSIMHEVLKHMHSYGDDADSGEFLVRWFRANKPNCLAVKRYDEFKNTTDFHINSIIESCIHRIMPFCTSTFDGYLLNDEMDLLSFGRDSTHKTAIFISAGKSPTFDLFAEILYSQIIDTLSFET